MLKASEVKEGLRIKNNLGAHTEKWITGTITKIIDITPSFTKIEVKYDEKHYSTDENGIKIERIKVKGNKDMFAI